MRAETHKTRQQGVAEAGLEIMLEMEMKQEGMRLGLGLRRRFCLRLADKLPQRKFYAEFGRMAK